MRKKTRNLALCACLITLLLLAVIDVAIATASVATEGCHAENPSSRGFTMPGFNFNPESLDPDACRYSCAYRDYGYAGLQQGNLCWCTNAYEPSIAQASCDMACTDPSDTNYCGGHNANSIWGAVPLVKDLAITPISDVATFEPVSIATTMSAGTSESYSLQSADASGIITQFTGTFDYHFTEPGTREVVVTAVDTESNEATATLAVNVFTRTRNLDLTCPEAVEISTLFECTLELKEGSGATLVVTFDDGTTAGNDSPIYLADTLPFKVGSVTDDVSTGAAQTENLFLAFNHIARKQGTFQGWEFNVYTPGLFIFQIFRPVCGEDEQFCFRSYSCISPTDNCRRQTNRWAKRCTSGTVYSFTKRECVDTTAHQIVPNYFTSSWDNLAIQQYELVYEDSVSATSSGINYHRSTASFAVEQGDVIGVIQSTGVLYHEAMTSSCYELAASSSHVAGNPYTFSGSANCFDGEHQFLAHLLEPETAKFTHNYTDLLDYNMTVNVANALNDSAVAWTVVDVQERIEFIVFTAPVNARTNDSVLFACEPHPGSEVTYNWTYGDGGVDSLHGVDTTTHTFTQAGVYTVSLYIYNKISNASFELNIVIQDSIENFLLDTNSTHEDEATILGDVTYFLMTISQGTNVTYSIRVDMNDTTYVLAFDGDLPSPQELMAFQGLSAMVGFVYPQVGNYSVTANVSNLVSNMTAEIYIPVQIPITGMSIVQPPPIPFGEWAGLLVTMASGTNITMTTILEGELNSNFSLEEGDGYNGYGTVFLSTLQLSATGTYTLNVTYKNLVTPLAWDSVSVYVDYRVRNFEIVIDRPFVPVSEQVTFNMSIQWGSRFTLNVTWGDGTPAWDEGVEYELDGRDVSNMPLADPDPYWIMTHTYTSPGNYSVVYSFNNIFGPEVFTRHVVVQYPVTNMFLATDAPVEIYTTSADLELTVSFAGGHLATQPYYLYDYGDGESSNGSLQVTESSPWTSSHTYHICGSYNLTLNISNFVNHMFFVRTIEVDDVITGLVATATPYHVITGESTIITMTSETGTRMNTIYDFQDGDTENHLYYDECLERLDMNRTESVEHFYYTPAHYNVTVRANSSVSDVTVETVQYVIVQHPILNMELLCDDPIDLLDTLQNFIEQKTCHIFVANGTEAPTDAYVQIEWDDGVVDPERLIVASDADPSLDNSTYVHVISLTHTTGYRTGDDYNVTARLHNLVSSTVLYFNHTLYEEIVGLYANVLWMDQNNTADGFGHTNTVFRISEPVEFRSGYERGSHMRFTWDYGDGTGESFYNNPNTRHLYLEPGEYEVTLVASNRLDSETTTRAIRIQREVSPYLTLWTQSPMPTNNTFNFSVMVANSTLADIGTAPCYRLWFGGDDNATVELTFFGNLTQCERTFPTEFAIEDPEVLIVERHDVDDQFFQDLIDSDEMPNITISNHYMSIGQWIVTLTGVNIVSRVETSFRLVTTEGPCYNPSVDLATVNLCTAGVNCHGDENMLSFLRSVYVEIRSRVRYDCAVSSTGYYIWNATSVDEVTGEETQIDLMQQANTLEGINQRQLILLPRSLPYGLVRIYLNVSMDGVIGVYSLNYTDIYILKSSLIGDIWGGTEVARKWNTNITIDALSLVNDPDVEEGDYSGMAWTWYCKRRCESWPEFSDNLTIVPGSDFNSSCDYSEVGNSDDQGCFMHDGVDGPIEALVGGENGLLAVDTFNIIENDFINIKVVVTKDTRVTELRQTIRVIEGDPPDIRIVCRTNCEDLVNPTARFSMLSAINGWRRGMYFDYWWYLYQIPDTYDPDSSYDDYVVNASRWSGYASTGLRLDNMAVDAGLFTNFPKDDYFYRFKVEAVRRGSSPDNKGWGTKDFRINDAPRPGYCTVVPQTGYALETRFNINCTEPFEDAEIPLSYEIGYRRDNASQIIWLYSGPTVTMDTGQLLQSGYEANDYEVGVVIKAKDRIGSVTRHWLNATVYEATEETTQALLSNMTSDPLALASILMAEEPAEAITSVLVYGGALSDTTPDSFTTPEDEQMLDELSQRAEDPSLTEEERAEAEQMLEEERQRQEAANLAILQETREAIIVSLSTIQPQSLTDVNQLMQASIVMTENPEQLTTESISTSLDITASCLSTVTSESDRATNMADDLENTVGTVLGTLDNLRMSIEVSSAPVSIVTDDDQQTNQQQQQQTADQVNQILTLIGYGAKAVFSRKVPGESNSVLPQGGGYGTVLECGVQFTENFDGSSFSPGESTIVSPSAAAILGENNDTYFISAQTTAFASNLFSYSNQTTFEVTGTPVMTVELFNDTDDVMQVAEIDELFEIELKLERDEPDVITGNTTDWGQDMTIYRIDNYTTGSALILRVTNFINESDVDALDVNPDDYIWEVFISIDQTPEENNADFNFTLPLPSSERFTMVSGLQTAVIEAANLASSDTEGSVEYDGITYRLPDKWTIFISNIDLEVFGEIEAIYFGIKHRNATDPEADFEPAAYSAQVYFQQCLWWVEHNATWSAAGCQVLPLSNWQTAYCGCNHLTSFSSGMVVPMNSIDLSNSAFLNLDSNPIVFATMVSIMCLYIVLCVWARKKDKSDAIKAGSTALLDNDPRDTYLYELVVWTGQRTGAGTTAKVRMIMFGEQGETESRLLWDDKRPVLQRRGVDSFVMACPHPLGQLTHLRIWHDNSGKSPGWYFSRMQVTDMQTKDQYFFIHDRWLAVEEDDGMIDHVIPVANEQELTSFHHLFWTKTQKNLTDGHIWFSVFQRPPRSRFTRVQRLTCCLALLFSSMMANILFYQQRDVKGANPQVYRIGPLQFTLAMIYVGFVSALIVFPASIGIVAIFRYSAERPEFLSKYKANKNKKDIYSEDVSKKEKKESLGETDENELIESSSPSPTPGYYERGVSFISVKTGEPVVEHAKPPPKKEKKTCHLPWWFIYIGYALALATVGVAFWMTVEVAGTFGPKKSKEWLFSFCVSVVESIFISQPLKVLLTAIFFALIWKKPDIEEDDRPKHLKPNEKWLHTHLTEKDMENPETQLILKQYRSGPVELDEEYLKAAREERFKEVKMMSILREVFFYLVFLYIIMMVGYGNRDPWSVYLYQNMKNTYLVGNQYEGKISSHNMYKVHSRENFFDWMKLVVFPGVYYERFYDGQEHNFLHGYSSDNNAYLIGEVRLRQVRVHGELCSKRIQSIVDIDHCEMGYSLDREDERDYMRGWRKPNISDGEEPDKYWKYRTWQELDGYPYWGRIATYAGGGYVANLGRTNASGHSALEELIEYEWIDEKTRAVFVEFLLFNANMNLFSVSQMAVEFAESGAGYSMFKFHVMRLNRYVGAFMFVVLAAEILTFLFIIYYIQHEIRKIIKLKRDYFLSFWNNVELFILSLCIGCIVMFFYRLFIGQRMEDEIHEDPYKFHNFQHVIIWDEAYAYLLGLIVFLSNVKFMKLLRFNKKLSQLSCTLQYASTHLISFSMIFLVLFCAFVQMAYLMFYSVLLEFSTFVRAAETMFSLMLDKFDFESMREADRFWAPVIIFCFTLFVSFILINFFLTILIEAYLRVRMDLSQQSNDYEIVDFMIERFKRLTGIGKRKKKAPTPVQRQLEFEPVDYVEGVDPNAAAAEELRERIEAMLDKFMLYVHYKADDKDVAMEMDALKGSKRKIVMS